MQKRLIFSEDLPASAAERRGLLNALAGLTAAIKKYEEKRIARICHEKGPHPEDVRRPVTLYVGEDGIEPNVAYKLDEHNKPRKVVK